MSGSTASYTPTDATFPEACILAYLAAVGSKTLAQPVEKHHWFFSFGNEDAPFLQRLRAPWRGNVRDVARFIPAQGLNCGLHHAVRPLLGAPRDSGYWAWSSGNLASGAIAGAAAVLVLHPLEYARIRVAFDKKSEFYGIADCLEKTTKASGYAGVYRGAAVATLAAAVYRGLYFGLYDSAKPLLQHHTIVTHFELAFAVTVVASFASLPLDNVHRDVVGTKRSSAVTCARAMLKMHGTGKFFRGGTRVFATSFAGAGVLAGFDTMLDVRRELLTWTYAPM
jgi:solute carrier family 25 (adenine nucleotide translocator) protein 4/5/6/31